jgi:hypothetical protein
MPEYRIKDWHTLFENHRTRQLEKMEWVPIPNKMDGLGYTSLVDHPNGAAHLGAWLAIIEVASKQDKEQRGELPVVRGSTAKALARLSRLPEELFEEVLSRLVSEDIAWIEEIRRDPAQERAQAPDLRVDPPPPRAEVTMEGNGIEGNSTPPLPPQGENVCEIKSPPQIRVDFEEDWEQFWVKLGKSSAYKAYCKARKTASREEIMRGVYVLGPLILENAKRQGITPVHPATWLNAGRWQDDPAAYSHSPPRRITPMDREAKRWTECEERLQRDLARRGLLNAG